jgi:hypothetical protein
MGSGSNQGFNGVGVKGSRISITRASMVSLVLLMKGIMMVVMALIKEVAMGVMWIFIFVVHNDHSFMGLEIMVVLAMDIEAGEGISGLSEVGFRDQ